MNWVLPVPLSFGMDDSILCWLPAKPAVLPLGAAMTIVLDPACVVTVAALGIDSMEDEMVLIIVLVFDDACCNN